MQNIIRKATIALLVLALPLTVACGDDDDDDTGDEASGDAAGGTQLENSDLVKVGETELGEILVDAENLTLYTFTDDEPGSGESTCYDGCATNWPPLLADGAAPSDVEGVSGSFDLITRTDGGQQVTYEGMPLYYFANDAAPGDTNGEGVGDKWFVVKVGEETASNQSAGTTPTAAAQGGSFTY